MAEKTQEVIKALSRFRAAVGESYKAMTLRDWLPLPWPEFNRLAGIRLRQRQRLRQRLRRGRVAR